MTTIAFRDGVMAAEGRSTLSGTILTDQNTKIVRLSDGALFALAGEDSYVAPLLSYLEGDEGAELPKADSSPFTALVVEVDGTIKLYEGVGDFIVAEVPFIAIGSGAPYAYGALDMGADPEHAVLLACKRDPNSGGDIQVELLGHVEPTEYE
jgi:ATP-dependent protease HslVU (ClpYQ) peptidase subunit